MLLGAAQVGFVDKNTRIDSTQQCAWLIPMIDGPVTLDWDHAEATDIPVSDLESTPEPSVSFAPLPAAASQGKIYETAEGFQQLALSDAEMDHAQESEPQTAL